MTIDLNTRYMLACGVITLTNLGFRMYPAWPTGGAMTTNYWYEL